MRLSPAEVEDLVAKCQDELEVAKQEQYDSEKADKTAALVLYAQTHLTYWLREIEFNAKNSKNEVERIEGERYHHYKKSSESKITEAALTHLLAQDEFVVAAKRSAAECEADAKKIMYLLNTLKEGHIYFRSLGKNKHWE